jgi:hypothetical protein
VNDPRADLRVAPRPARAERVARRAVVAVGFALAALTACVRPPVGAPPSKGPSAGRVGPVAFDTFTQDRPAIAGKWYDYDPSDHTLTPKAQAWIIRDSTSSPPRFAAFRIVTAYDANTAASGVFTLSLATYDGSTWSSETSWTASHDIHGDASSGGGPVCLDVFAQAEVDCASATWQLRMATFEYFSPLAGIAVVDPGLFVRSVDGTDMYGAVSIALVDGATDLASLPDPSTLADLVDAPPASFASTDWSFAALGRDLPRAGMAIGSRISDHAGDVWWLMTARYDLVRLTIAPKSTSDLTQGLTLSSSHVAVSRDDDSAPDTQPDATAVDVDVPAVGAAHYLTFTTADLALAATDLASAAYPFTAPTATSWDLAITQPAAGDVRILLSPAACAIDATALALDETKPPVDSP